MDLAKPWSDPELVRLICEEKRTMRGAELPQWKAAIDFKWTRDNKEEVALNIKNRISNANLELVLELYEKMLAVQKEVERLRGERNAVANKMKGKLEPSERQKLINEGKNLKEGLMTLEEDMLKLTDELQQEEGLGGKKQRRKLIMGVTFLSTIPSLVHLSSLSNPTTSTVTHRLPPRAGPICGIKNETDVTSENDFLRRDVLKCFGATIGMELITSSGSFVEMAYAADLIQRRQRSEFQSNIKGTLYTALKEKPELVPSILTLALNDAMTYDKASKSGGPNGSIRFSSEISRPENEGLAAALNMLEEAKEEIDSYSKGGPISFADLIQCADVLPWVQKYQRSRETVSQTDYEVDLITTLTKLSSLGQQINYEAYTYPVRKIDVTKLKL
ncbi:L-ascorbate peroxidase, putative [Ricinus communis]|uniref:L-ascorbate peroxidase, putative n=1 Tax=Ricinus communis TaxID=3988 RepID=B9RJP3_RICCO|nr:L-ascorbate peroxidase, putative [Ricinus communis]